jgi:hypothetical protein
LNGCDAVVSSLGTGLSPFLEVSLLTVATGALVTVMTRNGVRRLVCISALGTVHVLCEHFRGSTNQHAIPNRKTSAKEKEILLIWRLTYSVFSCEVDYLLIRSRSA